MEKKEIDKMKKVKALLYCTKKQPYLVKDDIPLENEPIYYTQYKKDPRCCGLPLNGKILAECDIKTEEIKLSAYSVYEDTIYLFDTSTLTNDQLTEKSWLCNDELDNYLINEKGYALHISNLKIFDKPKELNDYNVDNSADYGSFGWAFEDNERITPLKKAPQNMMRVYDKFDNEYILISVRSEWLCKILDGDKTIEVRKKVLKEML